MLDQNTHQGYFGECLVAAIAGAAGLDVMLPRLGHRIDMSVYDPGPKGTSSSKQVTLQVKSWRSGTLSADDHYHYPLEVPAFNHLAGGNHDVRHYLVLCIVPSDAADYLTAEEHQATLRHAAYWLSLRDQVPDLGLNPDSTKTVNVPRRNRLTPETMALLVNNNEASAVVP